MKINYRILEVNPNDHSVVARYYTDTITEEMLAIDLDATGKPRLTANGIPTRCRTDYSYTIFDSDAATKEDIIKIVERASPAMWLKIMEDVANTSVDTSLSSVTDIVGEEFSFVIDDQQLKQPIGPDIATANATPAITTEISLQTVLDTLNTVIANTGNRVVLVTE
jgi:hypothetical protein